MNPIEKVERSSLIVASTVHEREPAELLLAEQVERVAKYSGQKLLGVGGADGVEV